MEAISEMLAKIGRNELEKRASESECDVRK